MSSRIVRLRTGHVKPFHRPQSRERVECLVTSMRQCGWRGRPLLVYQSPGHWQAVTGSHRLAAAGEARLGKVPCLIIPPSARVVDGRRVELREALGDCDNTVPLFQMLNEFGAPTEVIGLMTLDMLARPDPDFDPELYDWRAVGEFAADKWRRGEYGWGLPPASELVEDGQCPQ